MPYYSPFQTHFKIPFMLLPTSILYFVLWKFCISACLFKFCHTTPLFRPLPNPIHAFAHVCIFIFQCLWISIICLYSCTSMCLYDCMCVFLYCCVPPFFQTTSKSHSCFRQLGKMKFRLNLMLLVEYLAFLFLCVFLRCCISITVPIKCHKHNISATISGGSHNSCNFLSNCPQDDEGMLAQVAFLRFFFFDS